MARLRGAGRGGARRGKAGQGRAITMNDEVMSPAHYTQGPIECIDAIRAQLSDEEWRGFLRGQVAKYTWRLGRKGERDAEKVLFYASLLAGIDPRAK